eukprot:gene8742-9464_t
MMRSYLQVLLATPSNSSSNSSSSVTPASEPLTTSTNLSISPIESVNLLDDTSEDSSGEETSDVILTETGSKKRRKTAKRRQKESKKRNIMKTPPIFETALPVNDETPPNSKRNVKNVKITRTNNIIDLLNKTYSTDVYKRVCFAQYPQDDEFDPSLWSCCECGEPIVQAYGTGIGNLRRHFATHDDCIEWIKKHLHKNNLNKYFIRAERRDHDIYGWINFIVKKNLPFSVVEDEEYRRVVHLGEISIKTLLKYMHLIGEEVRKEIVQKLAPTKFGLLFDGWSDGNGTHYCGIFAVVPTSEFSGHETLLLAMSPFEDESSFDGDQFINFINQTLEQYEIDQINSKNKVLFLVGDNANINVSIATKMKIPLIGCYSHRLSLACKKLFETEKTLLEKIDSLMQKLSNNKPRGYLRKKPGINDLSPITKNKTRWLSTFNMIKRMIALQPLLKDLNFDRIDKEINPLLLSDEELQTIEELYERLKPLEDVTIDLQKEEGNDLGIARAFFDGLLAQMPELGKDGFLDPSYSHCQDFENAVVKVYLEILVI